MSATGTDPFARERGAPVATPSRIPPLPPRSRGWLLAGVLFSLPGVSAADTAEYHIPLFRPGDSAQQGFARIINESAEAGTVRIHGIDDAGERWPGPEEGTIALALEPGQTRHFNSGDLERGNPSKGLSGGLGDGQGNWRLWLSTGLDIKVSAYIRTGDGFVTSMHEVVRPDPGVPERHHVQFFNSGSNRKQVSWLRVVNLTGERVTARIEGVDDAGAPGEGEVRVVLAGGAARMLSAPELEEGGDGFGGCLSDAGA